IITHANFSSAVTHLKAPLFFDSTCRAFDFVSYAFGLAWLNAFHTLAASGFMCISNERDTVTAIRGLRVN
ncbi:hypothetical protein F5883DRAFT_413189, partial [Diaporthe sp. PMI_573]